MDLTTEPLDVNKPKVFMSHNWNDKSFVRRLTRDLRAIGIHVWLDEAEIKVGDSLIEKIRQGIDDVDYLAVVLSSNSIASEWVKKEVDIAMNQEIERKTVKVLPILLEPCELLGFLKGKAFADFTTEDKYSLGLERLCDRIGISYRKTDSIRGGYLPFPQLLLEECLRHLNFATRDEWEQALTHNSNRVAHEVGDWLLEMMAPPTLPFWSGRSPVECRRMELLAKVVKAMECMTWRAELVRDKLIAQTSDTFEYDWEYNDLVQNRMTTIYKALRTIGDKKSLDALARRWPNGLWGGHPPDPE